MVNIKDLLTNPTTYSHNVVPKIDLIETHASIIALTGEFAYKVKKPVNFGFLDYSTIDLRKKYCAAELIRNKLGAPEIYIETGEFTLNDMVEPFVKMYQFNSNNILFDLAKNNSLTENNIDELVTTIFEYHNKTKQSNNSLFFGKAQNVRIAFDENYEQTIKYINLIQQEDWFRLTKEYTDTFFSKNESLFESRLKNGKVREIHGDMHLNNICYFNNKIQLFDCIEFNDSFYNADFMYDIAYIIMDLDFLGLKSLSEYFLKKYIDLTNDYEGLEILPLYLSRQSYVRAKVLSFQQDHTEGYEKQDLINKAKKYYELAYNYTNLKF